VNKSILAAVDFSQETKEILERVPVDMLTGVMLAKSFAGRVQVLRQVARDLRPNNSVLADRLEASLQKEAPNGVLGLFF